MPKRSTTSPLHREVNMHIAFIAIALVAAIAGGLVLAQSKNYQQAMSEYDTAVLGAMTQD